MTTGKELIQILLEHDHLLNCDIMTDGGEPWRHIDIDVGNKIAVISAKTKVKIKCPFINNLAINSEVECVYLLNTGKCDDIEICPGCGDAWCTEKIQTSILSD